MTTQRQIMTTQRQIMLTERQIEHLEREMKKIEERWKASEAMLIDAETCAETGEILEAAIYEPKEYGTTTNTQADTFFNIYK